jgi:hypothetical protein
LIVDDKLIFEVQNHNFVAGGKNYVKTDFHTYHRKKLCVTYSFNSGPLQAAVEMEEGVMRLPPPPALGTTPQKPLPVLDLAFSGGEIEVFDSMVVFNKEARESCFSIRVHNKRAEPGEDAHRVDSLSAQLVFASVGSSRTTHVDRACWIGKTENEICLNPTDTEHILLGIPGKEYWVIYDNPNKHARGGWPAIDQPLREVKFRIYDKANIVGEISLVAHRNNISTTLLTRKFVISVSGSNLFCNVRWQDEI